MFYRPCGVSSGQKVFLATPCHSGGISAGFTHALFSSSAALSNADIAAELALCSGECHVDDARNHLVRDFLETDCTDLVFIDADVAWEPHDLVKLCQYDADVVAGVYPLKQGTDGFPIFQLPGEQRARPDGLLEVVATATGFMRIKRHVLRTLYDASSKFRRPGDQRSMLAEIFKRTMQDGYRWGGDTQFCKLWRDLGGQVFVSPEMFLEHFGETQWDGTLGAHLRRVSGFSRQHCLAMIRSGTDTHQIHRELVKDWGNAGFAATAEFNVAVSGMARKSRKIVEFGSGLSTLVAAAATDGDVTSYEHNPAWIKRMKPDLAANVRLMNSEIDGDPPFYTRIDGRYDMAICDGPPRTLAPNRVGMYSALESVLEPGGTFIIDDLDTPTAIERFMAWVDGRADFELVHGARTFAIGRLHKLEG